MTFILEIKLQIYQFLQRDDDLLSYSSINFEPQLGWKCAYLCHNLRTKKRRIKVN